MNINEKNLRDLLQNTNSCYCYDAYANESILREIDRKIIYSITRVATTLFVVLEKNVSIPLSTNNKVSETIIKQAKKQESCFRLNITDIIILYNDKVVKVPFTSKEKDEILSEMITLSINIGPDIGSFSGIYNNNHYSIRYIDIMSTFYNNENERENNNSNIIRKHKKWFKLMKKYSQLILDDDNYDDNLYEIIADIVPYSLNHQVPAVVHSFMKEDDSFNMKKFVGNILIQSFLTGNYSKHAFDDIDRHILSVFDRVEYHIIKAFDIYNEYDEYDDYE